jgi:hypothetical protein
MALKAELTVLNLCSFFVCGRCVDVSMAEEQGYLDSLLLG